MQGIAINEIEEWRQVVGYEGLYEVSSLGRVKSLERIVLFKNGKKKKFPTMILKNYNCPYPRVRLNKEGVGSNNYVHVLLCAAFIGKRPPKHYVNHIDGIKENSILSNLEYVTASENNKHAFRLGLNKPNHKSKRTNILCRWCSKSFRPKLTTTRCCSKSCNMRVRMKALKGLITVVKEN